MEAFYPVVTKVGDGGPLPETLACSIFAFANARKVRASESALAAAQTVRYRVAFVCTTVRPGSPSVKAIQTPGSSLTMYCMLVVLCCLRVATVAPCVNSDRIHQRRKRRLIDLLSLGV